LPVDADPSLPPSNPVPRDYDTPIPIETVCDLLGLTRALYAAFVELGPAYDDQRWKVRGIGHQLRLALQRAGEGGHQQTPVVARSARRMVGL
jgi:hypothetical protein